MTDKISNTFRLSEHLRLGKFMSIGHTALLFAASSSFTILCIIYCLSVFSEETHLQYHLFGMTGVVFVILSAFLLHFLLAKSELSDFLPHRRNIVFFWLCNNKPLILVLSHKSDLKSVVIKSALF